jgi:septal ring factor EnvC (AmiA/AmiB activator)
MKDIQEIFNQIKDIKKEQKDIRSEYKDMLAQADDYEVIIDKATELREKKKQIESIVQQKMGLRWQRMEDLKIEKEKLDEMISDIAISSVAEGKPISITDEYQNEYEPVYKVVFKKIK